MSNKIKCTNEVLSFYLSLSSRNFSMYVRLRVCVKVEYDYTTV